MQIYREILPHSYLVILVETAAKTADIGLLRDALRRAGRSRKESVWLDCSGLSALTPDFLSVLTRYAAWLRRRHTALIVCHPPATPSGISLQEASAGTLLVANTLLDAELVASSEVSQPPRPTPLQRPLAWAGVS